MGSPGGDVSQSCTLVRETWSAHRTLIEKQCWASRSNKQHGEEQTVTLSLQYQQHTHTHTNTHSGRLHVEASPRLSTYTVGRGIIGESTWHLGLLCFRTESLFDILIPLEVLCVCVCVCVCVSAEPTTQYNALNPASSQVSQCANYSTWKHLTFFIITVSIAV